jgi:hypothetical protein
MQSRKARQSDFFWPLFRAALIWLVVAQGALMISPSLELSPEPFVYLAIVGFAVQSIRSLVTSVMAYGFSWRIYIILSVCLAAGTGLLSRLPSVDLDWAVLAESISAEVQWARNEIALLDRLPWLDNRQEPDSLGPTAKRIFAKETPESLAEARRSLHAIPERSPSYNQSRALLKVVDRRLEDVESKDGARRNKKRPIQTTSVEQTGHGLRVTLRNNSKQSVRNIRYRIEYFRADDGAQIDPENLSWIRAQIPPGATSKFEINDARLNREIFGSFSIVSWDSEPIVE